MTGHPRVQNLGSYTIQNIVNNLEISDRQIDGPTTNLHFQKNKHNLNIALFGDRINKVLKVLNFLTILTSTTYIL